MVYNSMKQQVDKGNSRVNGPDATVLEVDLPPLVAGTYHVYWKVLAKDTHVTEGDFTFAIQKKISHEQLTFSVPGTKPPQLQRAAA